MLAYSPIPNPKIRIGITKRSFGSYRFILDLSEFFEPVAINGKVVFHFAVLSPLLVRTKSEHKYCKL